MYCRLNSYLWGCFKLFVTIISNDVVVNEFYKKHRLSSFFLRLASSADRPKLLAFFFQKK